MSGPDSLLAELDAMSPDDRAVILGALTRKERDLLASLGRALPTRAAEVAGISPWLAAHVHAARQAESVMTPATRDALLRAVGVPMREPQANNRSLVGAFGGLLASRGAAR